MGQGPVFVKRPPATFEDQGAHSREESALSVSVESAMTKCVLIDDVFCAVSSSGTMRSLGRSRLRRVDAGSRESVTTAENLNT